MEMNGNPDESCTPDDDRLRDLPLGQDQESSHGDCGCPEIANGVPSKDDHGSGDGAGRCRRHSLDEGANLSVVGKAQVRRPQQDHEEIDGQKDAKTGGAGSWNSLYQVSDEPDGDHHWAWGDHSDRNSVEKLGIGEPMMLLNNTSVKKRNNGQAAAEHEQT